MKKILILLVAIFAIQGTAWCGPLHVAAKNGSINEIKELLAHGEDVNAKDEDGETPLHNAAENKNPKVVKLLLDKGAKFTREDFENFAKYHDKKDEIYRLLHDASFR